MKNPWPVAVMVALLLLAGAVVGWIFRSASLTPAGSGAGVRQETPARPVAAPSPVEPSSPVQALPGQAGSSQGEATPEFVTEPVTELAADEHGHDGKAEAPSQATIDAIREIRKPVAGEGQVIQHADGSAEMKLGNRYQSVPVATVGKDGKVHVEYHGEKYLQENQPGTQQSDPQKIQNTETQNP